MSDQNPRVYVVTGSASGIGAATQLRLEQAGHRVIGADRRDAEIICDIGTSAGRQQLVAGAAAASHGRIDAIIANAGIGPLGDQTVRVNFFGTLATVQGLRPLLTGSAHPRVVVVSSMASLWPTDPAITSACLDDDEEQAAAAALRWPSDTSTDPGRTVYRSSKHALNLWVRRAALTAEWAGAGIPLNAIAPGLTLTPGTSALLGDATWTSAFAQGHAAPLGGGTPGDPDDIARALCWFAGAENTWITGQVIFVDGGGHRFAPGDLEPGQQS